jgi:hypothetical protein
MLKSSIAVLLLVAACFGVAFSVGSPNTADNSTCRAVKANNGILHDLAVTLERRTLQLIDRGQLHNTPDQARSLYSPTIRRINNMKC